LATGLRMAAITESATFSISDDDRCLRRCPTRSVAPAKTLRSRAKSSFATKSGRFQTILTGLSEMVVLDSSTRCKDVQLDLMISAILAGAQAIELIGPGIDGEG
jgi:hypothetical protein